MADRIFVTLTLAITEMDPKLVACNPLKLLLAIG